MLFFQGEPGPRGFTGSDGDPGDKVTMSTATVRPSPYKCVFDWKRILFWSNNSRNEARHSLSSHKKNYKKKNKGSVDKARYLQERG